MECGTWDGMVLERLTKPLLPAPCLTDSGGWDRQGSWFRRDFSSQAQFRHSATHEETQVDLEVAETNALVLSRIPTRWLSLIRP